MTGAALVAALAVLGAPQASGHELSENRATLIKREDRHLSLTLYLNYPAVLQRVLEPSENFAQFVVTYSALPPADFAARLQKAQALLQANVRLHGAGGDAPAKAQWRWPEQQAVQSEFRALAMQFLTEPNTPPHDDPVEVQADFLMNRNITAIRTDFPIQMQPVLVVSYAPRQAWATPKTPAPEFHFYEH